MFLLLTSLGERFSGHSIAPLGLTGSQYNTSSAVVSPYKYYDDVHFHKRFSGAHSPK